MQRNDQPLDDPLERYLAFEGLIQWTHAVIAQSERLSSAKEELGKQRGPNRIVDHRLAVSDYHTQCHYFAIAAYKLLEFRDWAKSLKLFPRANFSEISEFPRKHITDLRDMREHAIAYFKGKGDKQKRWVIETPDYNQTPRRPS
jgi:hypothetical protein